MRTGALTSPGFDQIILSVIIHGNNVAKDFCSIECDVFLAMVPSIIYEKQLRELIKRSANEMKT